MLGSRKASSILGLIIFVGSLLATLAWLHQPATAQTPPEKVWFNYLSPGEISYIAVAGDDIWAATYGGLIHWNRVSGEYIQYSPTNGLPEGEITALALDAAGRPWVASHYGGLSYLDGEDWVPVTDVGVNDLMFTDDSAVSGAGAWVATAHYGVSFYKVQPLPEIQATYTVTEELSVGEPTVLALDQAGQPWVGGQEGVSYFDGQGWISYTVESGLPAWPVTVLVFDPKGQPWVGTAGGGVSRLNPEGSPGPVWTTFTLTNGLAGNWVTTIAFDAAGQPWVGTSHSGVSHLSEGEEGQAHWTNYTVADGLAGNVIDTIFLNEADQPWMVTRNDGVSTFDGQQWTNYPYPSDLADGWITATTLDESRQMWIGQANGQVSQLVLPEQGGTPSWITYGTTGPASNSIGAVALDGTGRLWVGTKAGASVLDGQSWTSYDEEDGLIDNDVTALAADLDGSLWFGTHQGISHFEGQQWANYPMSEIDPSGYNKIQTIAIDPQGGKWFGSSTGLSYFDGQSWITYTVESGLANNDVKAIAVEAPGHLWLGTSGGVSQLILDDSGVSTWTTYRVEDGLANNDVWAVAIDATGNKWFGTYGGLTKFDGQNWTTYAEADGLTANWSTSLAFDAAGHLWVGHKGGGITEFDGQNWIVHSTTLRVTGLAADPAGPVWFGTDLEGLRALVDPAQVAALALHWKPAQSSPEAVTPAASNVPAQVVPPPAHLSPAEPPAQPLRAWSVAPDGAVFVLDADNRLYQLAPSDLTPLAQSQPLFNSSDRDLIYLLADTQRLFVGQSALTQTLVLDRADFSEITRLPQAGPMTEDPGRQLILIPQDAVIPYYKGAFWAYNLADLEQPPRQGSTPSCTSGPPVAEPLHRHLYLQTRNCDGSPPHQRDYYLVYDLDILTPLEGTEGQDPGDLSRPAIAGQADVLFTVYNTASGSAFPMVLDLQGQELEKGQEVSDYGRRPVTDNEGQWLYLIRTRGLSARPTPDLVLQNLLPFTNTAPADIALSPEADTLYLFGNGWLTALSTAKLQTLGIQAVSPLPEAWLQNTNAAGKLFPLYVYPSPTFEQDNTALLELMAPSERYRTTDGGRSWTLQVPADKLPTAWPSTIGRLSFSPNFAQDQTVVSPDWRSTDGGESWVEWDPPLAFTSDRSGNRDIYTVNHYGKEVQPITNNPAADENSAWSPAWTWLAFQSDRSGNWDIFSIRPDCPAECKLQQLSNDPADDMLPAWSPDGRLIAFVSTRDGNPEIYVMDPDGGNQRRLTFNEAGDWRPAWLRDSQHLIFTSDRNGNNDIYQITVPPADGPAPTAELQLISLITNPADDRDPAVAPDGTIFFLSDRDGLVRAYSYGIYSNYPSDEIKAYSDLPRSEAHPSPEREGSLLVSLEQNGQTNLYRTWSFGQDDPLTNTPGFNGQPAAGPVWWQPDPEASREWLASHP